MSDKEMLLYLRRQYSKDESVNYLCQQFLKGEDMIRQLRTSIKKLHHKIESLNIEYRHLEEKHRKEMGGLKLKVYLATKQKVKEENIV